MVERVKRKSQRDEKKAVWKCGLEEWKEEKKGESSRIHLRFGGSRIRPELRFLGLIVTQF